MYIHEELLELRQSGGTCGCGIPGWCVPLCAPAERCRWWAKAPRLGLPWVGAALPQSSPRRHQPQPFALLVVSDGTLSACDRGAWEGARPLGGSWRWPRAGASPGGAAGRAGVKAPRRRLAEVWPRQCEGFPPSPRRGRAGGEFPAATRAVCGAGAELLWRREPHSKDEEREKTSKNSAEVLTVRKPR